MRGGRVAASPEAGVSRPSNLPDGPMMEPPKTKCLVSANSSEQITEIQTKLDVIKPHNSTPRLSTQ